MSIYIIILHYKNIKDTIECLNSIQNLAKNRLNIKVILVDNDSTVTLTNSLYKSFVFEIIHNEKNLGYAGGMNIGIRKALKDKSAKYILILNNDTVLPSNLLTKLLDNSSDIIGPVIAFRWNSKLVYDFGGSVNWWTGRTHHMESSSKLSKEFYNIKIDYVSGCCMLVRREVFRKIGLFDERYFFYFEDVDFCVRAKKAGFSISVNPDVYIYHKLGGSIGRWTNKAITNNIIGNFIFINKHLGWRRVTGYGYLFALTAKIVFDRVRGYISKEAH